MEEYKIKTNELFFNNLIRSLREGGIWVWKDFGYIFTKRNNKLVGDTNSLKEIKEIVSYEYYKKNFENSDK